MRGAADETAEVGAFKIGADDYLAAPLRPAVLMAARGFFASAPRLPLQRAAHHNRQSVRLARRKRRSPPTPLPAGWAECELCGHRGPRRTFEKEDAMGRMKLRCGKCGEADHVIISID